MREGDIGDEGSGERRGTGMLRRMRVRWGKGGKLQGELLIRRGAVILPIFLLPLMR